MLRVLIIDDEPLIRKGLKTIIRWNDYGFDICGEASYGRDGLEKIKELKPDLIIVDVKMPGMSGLDMLQELKSSDADCKAIILSGYSDFTYAQKAMEYDTEYYLLKPVDRKSLIEKVKTLYDSIMKEKKEKEYLSKSVLIMREKILENLVNGVVDESFHEKINDTYGFGFPWDYYQVILMEAEATQDVEEQLMQSAKLEALRYINDKGLGIMFYIGRDLAILSKNRMFQVNNAFFEEINNIFKRICNFDITFAAGTCVKSLDSISASYRHANNLLRKKFIYGPARVISGNMETVKNDEGGRDNIKQQDLQSIINDICLAIELNCTQSINDLMEELRASYENSNYSEEIIKVGYTYIYAGVINKLLDHTEEMKDLLEFKESVFFEIFHQKSLKRLHGFIKYKLISISDELSKIKPDTALDRILEYISRNFREDLKLETLARIFNYNSAYLGKIFKIKTGMYFNTYLDTVRMEKARQLLKNGMKVYQVAKNVGYDDIRYFYKKFHKYIGVPPSAYKEKTNL
jgi:two-component system response regulator YesN